MGFVAVAALFLLAAVAAFLFKSKKTGNTVILRGPMDSGKTVLFQQLLDGASKATHTSSRVNEATDLLHLEKDLAKPPSVVRLVDFPGHERLAAELQTYTSTAAGIVLLVGCTDTDKSIATSGKM